MEHQKNAHQVSSELFAQLRGELAQLGKGVSRIEELLVGQSASQHWEDAAEVDEDLGPDEETEHRDLLLAAYVACFDLTYQEINALTGRSTADISRSLARLRAKRRLQTKVRFASREEQYQTFANMRRKDLEERLATCFAKGSVNEILVLNSLPGNSVQHEHERLHHTARLAAERLLRYLEERDREAPPPIIGISWGKSLDLMVSELAVQLGMVDEKRRPKGAQVFNSAGDLFTESENQPRSDHSLRSWSSSLAKKLSSLLDGGFTQLFAPVWLSQEGLQTGEDGFLQALRQRHDETRKVLERYPNFTKILGGIDPQSGLKVEGWVRQADVALSGIGNQTSFENMLQRTDGRDRHRLYERVKGEMVGDFSGNPLTRSEKVDPDAIEFLTTSLIGATTADFQHVAEEARQPHSTRLGVMAVAAGRNKALPTLAAVRKRLVNVLVIDSELASAIIEISPTPGS